jgi:hypothetical protein
MIDINNPKKERVPIENENKKSISVDPKSNLKKKLPVASIKNERIKTKLKKRSLTASKNVIRPIVMTLFIL